MKVWFCGGASEVGASCILLKVNNKNILLDCGIRMSNVKDSRPDLRIIQENGGVDAIVISHAHMDHIGALPIIHSEYPHCKIYMSHPTKDLMRVLLYDSLKIMEKKEDEIPLYHEAQVLRTLNSILCYSPGYTINPFNDELGIVLYSAGHILGATSVYITSNEGAFFYSGDFMSSSQRTISGASIPRLRPDIAIFESTYGDKLHSNRENEEDRLINKVKDVITNGGKVLIPAFALGRSQEVILVLKGAINKGIIPKVKVYIDGMVKNICTAYKLNPNYLKKQLSKKVFKDGEIFYDDNIVPVTKRDQQRNEIVESKEPCIIVTSSGMLSGGPSQWYASKLVTDERNFIAITGYQDEEAPGRQITSILESEEAEKTIKIGETTLPLKCGIGKYGLSAHADKNEIISLVKALSPKNVFLNHGNPEVIELLAKQIQSDYRGRIYVPINGEEFNIEIFNKRKQIKKNKIDLLNIEREMLQDDVKVIWEYIINNYSSKLGLSIEEIIDIWYGGKDISEEKVQEIREFINKSIYFDTEMRRPFIFHAVEKEDLSIKEDGIMEVNEMLALVDSSFPKSARIYKKGARFEEKIVLIYFVFPKTAQNYVENIKDFEKKTGWKVEVNTQCNLSEAENIIRNIIENQSNNIEKISYKSLTDSFKVKIYKPLAKEQAIKNEYKNITGMDIEFEVRNANVFSTKTQNLKAEGYEMEQNQAFSVIQREFDNSGVRLYKKSLKHNNLGKYVEISFITPVIGEKYIDLIQQLEQKIFWKIKISEAVNQHEVMNIGKTLLEKYEIKIKKNLAYMPSGMKVVAKVDTEPLKMNEIVSEFMNLTGLTLEFKYK